MLSTRSTIGYASPEQATGRALDHRTAVFSLGTCLHEMLCGKRLFAGHDHLETLRLVSESTAQPPSKTRVDVSKALDTIVMTALLHHREERWQQASRFGYALKGLGGHERTILGERMLLEWMQTAFRLERVQAHSRLAVYLQEAPTARANRSIDALAPDIDRERLDECSRPTSHKTKAQPTRVYYGVDFATLRDDPPSASDAECVAWPGSVFGNKGKAKPRSAKASSGSGLRSLLTLRRQRVSGPRPTPLNGARLGCARAPLQGARRGT